MYHNIPYYFNTNYYYFYGDNQYYTSFQPPCLAKTHQSINLSQNHEGNQKREAEILCGNTETTESSRGSKKVNKNQENLYNKMSRRRKRQRGKQIESAKKNSQSNIVNHILCFLGRENQSLQILTKIINKNKHLSMFSLELKKTFYSVLKLINLRRGRSYVNVQTLLGLFRGEDIIKEIPQIQEILPFGCQIEDLCYLFRVCIFYFLRNMSDITILSSRRMNYDGKRIHLSRWRLVMTKIMQGKLVESYQQESE